jgi:hypothetical protein
LSIHSLSFLSLPNGCHLARTKCRDPATHLDPLDTSPDVCPPSAIAALAHLLADIFNLFTDHRQTLEVSQPDHEYRFVPKALRDATASTRLHRLLKPQQQQVTTPPRGASRNCLADQSLTQLHTYISLQPHRRSQVPFDRASAGMYM